MLFRQFIAATTVPAGDSPHRFLLIVPEFFYPVCKLLKLKIYLTLWLGKFKKLKKKTASAPGRAEVLSTYLLVVTY